MLGIAGTCTLVDMVFISTGDTSELKKGTKATLCISKIEHACGITYK